MMFRRPKRTGEPEVPPGYSRLEPVSLGGPVVAWRAVQDATARPVMLFVGGAPGDVDRLPHVLAALPEHPGLAAVYETGRTASGRPYVVSAAPGPSIGDRITEIGPLPAEEAVTIVARVAAGLSAAHRAGVVHGGVRPKYVLHDGRTPVLTGFWPSPPVRRGSAAEGEVLALAHLAPEAIEGTEPAVTADVYGLASTLYTMLAGRPACDAVAGGGLAALLQWKLEGTLPDIPRPDLTAGLMHALRRGMAADPAVRFPSVAEFAAALVRERADATSDGEGAETAPAHEPGISALEFFLAADDGTVPAVVDSTLVTSLVTSPQSRPEAGSPASGGGAGGPWTATLTETAPLGRGAAAGEAVTERLRPGGAADGPTAIPATWPSQAPPGLDLERPGERSSVPRVFVIAAVALTVIAVAGVIGVVGNGRRTPEGRRAAGHESVPPGTTAPRPTATQEVRPPTKVELTRYQPTGLKAVPAPQQVVLSWRLPADAVRDGAGIVIRRQPADGGDGIAALSRAEGRLPRTYVAVPLTPGQQYCFLVGVLLQRAGGSPMLAQAGPVCASPR